MWLLLRFEHTQQDLQGDESGLLWGVFRFCLGFMVWTWLGGLGLGSAQDEFLVIQFFCSRGCVKISTKIVTFRIESYFHSLISASFISQIVYYDSFIV